MKSYGLPEDARELLLEDLTELYFCVEEWYNSFFKEDTQLETKAAIKILKKYAEIKYGK